MTDSHDNAYSDGYHAALADRSGQSTIALAREQGYREGYARALADVQAQIKEAISKYIVKTLAQARDLAGRLATNLRGTMETYDWRAGA